MPNDPAPISRLISARMEQDAALADILDRGLVNLRALARYLIRQNDWNATEEAVLSALRRHVAGGRKPSALDQARALLSRSHLHMRSRVCLVTLPKTKAAQQAVASVFQSIDYSKGEILRVIQTDRGIKVIVDEANLPKVHRFASPSHIVSVEHNLTEINVVVPDETFVTPGVLSLIFAAVSGRGINVVETVSGLPEHLVFVAEADAMAAYQALSALTSPPAARVKVVGASVQPAPPLKAP